jgi:hypothetical protein
MAAYYEPRFGKLKLTLPKYKLGHIDESQNQVTLMAALTECRRASCHVNSVCSATAVQRFDRPLRFK